MKAMGMASSRGSRALVLATAALLALVASAALVVGIYAIRNPNHIEFAPWPVVAELVAVDVIASLALGVQAQRRRTRRSLFAVEASAALVSLLMLAGVAYVLRFTNV